MDNNTGPTIFLDIDGVVATDKQFFMNRAKYHKKNPLAGELGAPYPFDPGCVAALNRILSETGARIVLSSDWRHHWSLAGLGRIFTMNGVSGVPVDVTGDLPRAHLETARWAEIDSYASANGIKDYVVLDDLNVGRHMSAHDRDRFFLTRSSEGLKQVGITDKIIARLIRFGTPNGPSS